MCSTNSETSLIVVLARFPAFVAACTTLFSTISVNSASESFPNSSAGFPKTSSEEVEPA